MGKEICTAPGCGGTVRCKRLCTRHYWQLRRGGNPWAETDPNLLPEDGIVDEVAVDAAIKGGYRAEPLRLTQREREIAGAVILARGGSEEILRTRLYLPSARSARELADVIDGPHGDASGFRAA